MDISQAILILLLSFQNGLLARTKGLQPVLYGFLTALLFIVCEFFGFMFMVLVIFRNIIDFSRVNTDISYKQKAVADIITLFSTNLLHPLTLLIFAMGGYFIVRYMIESKPQPNKPKNGVSELYPEKREEK